MVLNTNNIALRQIKTSKTEHPMGCAHHFKIDSENKGICKKCGEIKEWADYAELEDKRQKFNRQYKNPIPEDVLKEIDSVLE
jgi:hypothetical protein